MELHEPTVFLIRHGATSFNSDSDTESRLKGTRFDLPLTDEGHDEAEKVAQWLKDVPVASIRHSDMLRASQTAKHLEKATGIESEVDQRFDPWDVGYLSGHTREDAKRRIEYYIRNSFKTIPEGEAYEDWLSEYEGALLAELKAAEKEHNSPTYKARVIVSHSCNAMATDSIIKGDSPKFYGEQGEKPGGVVKIAKKAGKWRMADVDLSGPGSR